MLIEETTHVNQPLVEETLDLDRLLTDQARRADSSVLGDVLRDITPADELVSQQSMPAHQIGFPAAMRHGVPPDVIGVLAVTPDVRVPLRSLGLIAPDGDGEGYGMNTEEQEVAPDMDLGAQVGVMLALEYTAGSRSHRLSNGTIGYVRPFSGAATVMPVR